jgi:hypothetical protein
LRRENLVTGDELTEPVSNEVSSGLVMLFESSSDSSSLRCWIWSNQLQVAQYRLLQRQLTSSKMVTQ